MDYGGYDRVKIDSLRQIRWVLVPRGWGRVGAPRCPGLSCSFCPAGLISSRCRFKVPKCCWTTWLRSQVGRPLPAPPRVS